MRMLDLFCGEGLAAWGYWLSGRFSEIVGVDINPAMKSKYAFDFICADALTLDYEFLGGFDFIHASPPCQGYSKRTPDRSKHPRLIAPVHRMLYASARPYVIENVEGSGRDLRPNLVMNGAYFGLPSDRKRYFHATGLTQRLLLMSVLPSAHIYVHGASATRAEVIEALGLSVIPEKRLGRLTQAGMEQGIPPAMTRFIASEMFPSYKAMVA